MALIAQIDVFFRRFMMKLLMLCMLLICTLIQVGGFLPQRSCRLGSKDLITFQSSRQNNPAVSSEKPLIHNTSQSNDEGREATMRFYSSIFEMEDVDLVEASLDVLLNSVKYRRHITGKMFVDLLKLSIVIRNVDYSMKIFSKLISSTITLDAGVYYKLFSLINEKSTSSSHMKALIKGYMRQGASIDTKMIHELISHASLFENIQYLLSLLPRLGQELSVFHFNLALAACNSRIRHLPHVLTLYETMQLFDIKPNVVTYIQLLLAASHAEAGDVLFNIFREFQRNYPEEINSNIYGIILVGCVKCELWDEFDRLISGMIEKRIPFHQETVILCLKNLKSVPNSLAMITDQMISTSNQKTFRLKQFLLRFLPLLHEINATVFQAAMDEVRFTDPQIVLDIYEIIKHQNYVPRSAVLNRQIFSYALRAALRTQNFSLSFQILDDAFTEKADTMYYYNITISSLKRAKKYDIGCKVLVQYLKRRLECWNETVNFPPSHLVQEVTRQNQVISSSFMKQELLSCHHELSSMISLAILEITKNYALLFDRTTFNSSTLSTSFSQSNRPDSHYVNNLLIILQKLVIPYQIPLDPIGYPLACKLLLDGRDYASIPPLLRQAYISVSSSKDVILSRKVNMTRLFDTSYHGLLNQIDGIEQYHRLKSPLIQILQDIHQSKDTSLASYLLIKTFYRLFSLLPSHHRNNSTSLSAVTNVAKSEVYTAIFDLYLQSYQQIYAFHKQSYPPKVYSLFSSKSIHFLHPDEFYYEFANFLLRLPSTAALPSSVRSFPDKALLILLLERLAAHPTFFPTTLNLIQHFPQQLDVQNDVTVMTQLMIASAHSNNYAQLVKLLSYYHSSLSSQKMTYQMLSVVIEACLKNNRIYEAQLLLIFMRQQKIPRTITLYYQIFSLCCKLGHWNDAIDVYLMMVCDREMNSTSLKSQVAGAISQTDEQGEVFIEYETELADKGSEVYFNEEELVSISDLGIGGASSSRNRILASLKEISKLISSNRLFKTVTPAQIQLGMEYNLEKDSSTSFLSKYFQESSVNYERLKIELGLLSSSSVPSSKYRLARQLLYLFALKPEKYNLFIRKTFRESLKQDLIFPFSYLSRVGIPYYTYNLPPNAPPSAAAGGTVTILILQVLKHLLHTSYTSPSAIKEDLLQFYLETKDHVEDHEFIEQWGSENTPLPHQANFITSLVSRPDNAFNYFLQEYRYINFNMKVSINDTERMIYAMRDQILQESQGGEGDAKKEGGMFRIDIYPEAKDKVLNYLKEDWLLAEEGDVTVEEKILAATKICMLMIPFSSVKRVLTNDWSNKGRTTSEF